MVGEKRSGRKFSFVTDTVYLDSIAEEVKHSDLFVCEAMFGAGLEADAEVKTMAMIHYSPRYTNSDLKQNLADAQKVFPQTILSKDGLTLPIEYED